MATTRQHEGAIEFATPGVPGYVVMFLVSALVAPLFITGAFVVAGHDSVGPFDVVGLYVVGTFFAGFYGIPVALATTAVAHLALRSVWAQWVHVLVFGAVAAVVAAGLFAVLDREVEGAELTFGAIAGVAAAVGRFMVAGPRWRTRLLDSAEPSLR